MTQYPTRPKFFANRFMRLLAKTCAAQNISPEACYLLTVIVGVEDAKRYTGPVTFWNEQLMSICGFGGKGRLVRARQKAVEHRWLHYEHGAKGKAARYWVLIPEEFQELDDTPIDEDTADYHDHIEDIDGKDAVPKQNGNSDIQFQNSTESGRKADGIRHTFIPKPMPKPKSSCRGRCHFTDEDRATAEFIWGLILELQPERKPPNIETWANDVRLMRERDGRTHEQIRELFRWANGDEFWKTNILSPDKLRKKFDDLDLKRRQSGNGRSSVADGQRYDANAESKGVNDGGF